MGKKVLSFQRARDEREARQKYERGLKLQAIAGPVEALFSSFFPQFPSHEEFLAAVVEEGLDQEYATKHWCFRFDARTNTIAHNARQALPKKSRGGA